MGAGTQWGQLCPGGIDRCSAALNLFFPGDVEFKPSRPVPQPGNSSFSHLLINTITVFK